MRPHLQAAREKSLKQTLEYGVGFLHEGFSATERAVIERLFEAGAIQVLVATEQLGWGMTMLAHLSQSSGHRSEWNGRAIDTEQ
eukprot:g21764.t1